MLGIAVASTSAKATGTSLKLRYNGQPDRSSGWIPHFRVAPPLTSNPLLPCLDTEQVVEFLREMHQMPDAKWITLTQPTGPAGTAGVPVRIRASSIQAIRPKPSNPLGQGTELLLAGGSIIVLETVDAIVQAITAEEEE